MTAGALCLLAETALGADLAHQSRLGQVFAERPARVIIHGRGEPQQQQVDDFWIPLPPRTPGYYGTSRDYTYRSYYGTPATAIFSRLPYSCGFVGLC